MRKRNNKRFCGWLAIAIFVGTIAPGAELATVRAAMVTGLDEVVKQGGFELPTHGLFDLPTDVAVDAEGNRYVADQYNHRIQKFDEEGRFLLKWGTYGSGNGQFDEPAEVEVDAEGNVYVLDELNNRVQKFSADGAYIGQWGSQGTADNQFNEPVGLAVDASRNVYVSDMNGSIKKFNASGELLLKWGQYGSADDGQMLNPDGIAVDAEGNVYVADRYLHRVIKFSAGGEFLTSWGTQGSEDGQLFNPMGIAVDASANVYVSDSYNHRIQKFDDEGGFLAQWGSEGSETGQFRFSWGLTVDAEGNVHIADGQNSRVQTFGPDGAFQAAFGQYGGLSPMWGEGVVDDEGKLYILEAGRHMLLQFNASGSFMNGSGGAGSSPGQFLYPTDVAVDGEGNRYVADSGNYRIQKLDANGELIAYWGTQGEGEGQFGQMGDIGLDAEGSLYVLDFDRIQKFNADGEFLLQWPLEAATPSGDNEEQEENENEEEQEQEEVVEEEEEEEWEWEDDWGFELRSPARMAVSSDGHVFVLYEWTGLIAAYDVSGEIVSEWSTAIAGEEWHWTPFAPRYNIEADGEGSVYLLDPLRSSIRQYSSDGELFATWGDNEGEIAFPQSFVVAPDGRFYVTERQEQDNTSRIRVYERFERAEPEVGYVPPAPPTAPANGLGRLTLPAGEAGEVALGHEASVQIPKGAANRSMTITIEKAVKAEELLQGHTLLSGAVYELLKDMTDNFLHPVTVSFSFNPDKLKDGQRVGVFYYDELAKEWVEVTGATIQGDRVSAQVDHFTKFAVLAVDDMQSPAMTFSDTDGHWAQELIQKAVALGIASGYGDGTFRPERTVTRAEFTVMLANALQLPKTEEDPGFADGLTIADWAREAVASAAAADYVNGYEDGTFRPNEPISRAAMAVVIAAALGLGGQSALTTSFADDAAIPAWAKSAAESLKERGMMQGKGSGVFAPSASATRAEAMKLIVRVVEKLDN
ncbi:S-layer homology domain-containing protein [Paenibacillus sp. PL2-23]|uniref:S-layer homology domain-containing protein n=1 Tax=Paenibacillus sp. PL2-23 TaxID=2100729 RepID=UPI0030F81B08